MLIEGILRQSTFEDKDGNKKSTVEVVVDNVEFADDKRKEQPSSAQDFPPLSVLR